MVDLQVGTVLVTVDGSDESREAARYAVAVAERYDAGVHALYVVGDSVADAVRAGDVPAEDIADETRGFLDDCRESATAADVGFDTSVAYGFSTARKTHHPGNVVLDAAGDVSADFLVVPREATRGATGADVLEKVAEYVLLYASQPVLSV